MAMLERGWFVRSWISDLQFHMLVSRAKTQIVVTKYPTTEAPESINLASRLYSRASDLGISLAKQGRCRVVSIVAVSKCRSKNRAGIPQIM
jgi:hypothetical protein